MIHSKIYLVMRLACLFVSLRAIGTFNRNYKNSVRNEIPSILNSLFDKPPKPHGQNQSIVDKLKKYDVSSFSSTDNELLAKYGPLLFFSVNEKEYPILSEMAKMIFCLVPSSSPFESILSTTGNKQTKLF